MSLQTQLWELDSDWTPPSKFPQLRAEECVAIDVETCDPNLKSLGPGGVRGDGYIAGISVATPSGFRGYYPIAHSGGGNMDPNTVIGWLAE